MSTFTVTAEQLTIHPHNNADALELAQVGLYRAVVAKGAYLSGDFAVYIPEQSVLPDQLIEELGLTGRLAGPEKNRVKAVRLRGELSQGIVCLPGTLAGLDLERAHRDTVDFAGQLGIVKWVPEIPAHLSGDIEAAPDLLPWLDIENIKRVPAVFAPGEPVTATEKIHGSCCLSTWVSETGTFLVSSKGFAEKHCAIVASESNIYWRAARSHRVDGFAEEIANRTGASRVGVFGELFGSGIQDLGYGAVGKLGAGFRVFDVSTADAQGQVTWLSQDAVVEAVAAFTKASDGLPLQTVPRLFEGGYDETHLLALAEGREQVSGSELNLREGLVIRPRTERWSEELGGRAIVKVVSEAYLMRKGGTEFN